VKTDKHGILKRQIAAARAMGISELRVKFLELYGFENDSISVPSVRRRVIYKLQEIHLGGLEHDAETLLDQYADNDKLANLTDVAAKKRSTGTGAVYVREWHGQRYEVVCRGKDQFEFAGTVYKSLSAVAKVITNTKWNGRAFFGVK